MAKSGKIPKDSEVMTIVDVGGIVKAIFKRTKYGPNKKHKPKDGRSQSRTWHVHDWVE